MADLFSGVNSGNSGVPELFQPNLYPTSYSGMDQNFSSSVLNQLLPYLQRSISNASQSPQQFLKANSGGVIQTLLNNLSNRGILNSSVASDALAGGISGLAGTAAEMQTQLPSILGQLATNIGSYSESSNPLAPYEMLQNFVLNY